MPDFQVVSPYQPQGDQPAAIDALVAGVREGKKFQTLMGVTGSGKTFTTAHTIARLNRPTLVISHNKTLAAQLYEEFKELFPHNAVGYFVSYSDCDQPEAYIPNGTSTSRRTPAGTTIWTGYGWPVAKHRAWLGFAMSSIKRRAWNRVRPQLRFNAVLMCF